MSNRRVKGIAYDEDDFDDYNDDDYEQDEGLARLFFARPLTVTIFLSIRDEP